MNKEKADLLSDVWSWVAKTMGATESPGKRVVSPQVTTIKPAEDDEPVPRQREAERPHDAQ
jgi:hypothetical protein